MCYQPTNLTWMKTTAVVVAMKNQMLAIEDESNCFEFVLVLRDESNCFEFVLVFNLKDCFEFVFMFNFKDCFEFVLVFWN